MTRYRSCQQQCQEVYSENGNHLQRLAWDVTIFPSRISHYIQNFNGSYPVLFSIWNGVRDAFKNGDPIVKSIDILLIEKAELAKMEYEQLNLISLLLLSCQTSLLHESRRVTWDIVVIVTHLVRIL
jgi:hypothetical protein